ncbi:MAG TPA: ATP-binding protein [Gemmatimonadaceae bacterium]|nr:ATP-binding protein [Gemmatimonadaceae bacterium]
MVARKPEPGPELPAADALQALDEPYLVVGADWRIRFANRAFARLQGDESLDVTGRDLFQVLPPLARDYEAALVRATAADQLRRAFRIGGHGGEAHGALEVTVTGLAGGGVCVRIAAVSAASWAERALAERSEENASLSEVARLLAQETDVGTLLQVLCARAMVICDAAGANVGEIEDGMVHIVAGAGLGDALRGARFPLEGSLTGHVVAARALVRTDDYRGEFGDIFPGRPGFEPAVALGAPLIAHGEVLGVLLIQRLSHSAAFTEREERRLRAIADHAAIALWKTQLLAQVQEANRSKSEFMAVISHELRTPLTALTGYEELLADEAFGPLTEQQHAAIERMRTSTELLTLLIDEVLTVARLEAGREVVRTGTGSVRDVVNAAVAVLEPLALDKGLALRLLEPSDPVPLATDGEMVRRILVNLGANAIKFTDAGHVEIEAAAEGDEVRFVVRDTGIGIAPADLPRLFRPFTQLDSGVTRRYGGTGLGLYISQRLAGLLGGRLTVESTVGEGSAFTLRIPAKFPEAAPGTS